MAENNQGILPLDANNPTLIPNSSQSSVSGNTTILQSPAQLLAANPRVAAHATATVGGSVANDDVLNLTVNNPVLPSGAVTVSVTASGADTDATLAASLANAINSNSVLRGFDIFATVAAAVVTVNHNGPVGNLTTLTESVSPGSETITISGPLTGGSGPVIPLSNFTTQQGLSTIFLRQGQPLIVNVDFVTALVNGGANVK